jgi:tripartite-type tricarboxylate transporter receptor subunit TctC
MKQLPRRQFLHLASAAVALPVVTRYARAQSYPLRPVRIIVGFAPGGAPDILARLVAQWLSERRGQQFIVENRPGAGTNIATEAVARAPADGYSLLLASGANAINATLYDKLNFDFIRDIAPIAGVVRTPLVMVVNPSFPAKTIPEFIALARANPRKINMASPGTGSAPHLAGELFKMMAGVHMTHVPYRGGPPAIADLLGGQVQVFLGATTFLIGHIRAGRLRGLAVSTATRSEALPEIPSMSEFVPGFEASDWFGIVAAKATSAQIVDQLNKEINAGLADPTIREQLAEQGTVLAGSPAAFGKLIAEETEKWAKVIKVAGITPG